MQIRVLDGVVPDPPLEKGPGSGSDPLERLDTIEKKYKFFLS